MSSASPLPAAPVVRSSTAARVLMCVYGLAGAAAFAYFALRRLSAPRGSDEECKFSERLGGWTADFASKRRGTRPWIWIQAASVGEVMVARPLVARLREAAPACAILLTCNTSTGRGTAEALQADEVRYFPLDSSSVVEAVIGALRPCLFVAVETEIWPRTLSLLQERGVPTAFVNARISERSLPRYRLARRLLAPLLAEVGAVCARDAESASRWGELGADPARVSVAGDMKYDGIGQDEVDATVCPIAAGGFRLLLAASTHAGEEEVVIGAFDRLRAGGQGEDLRLVLAPRHPERARGGRPAP